MPSKDNFNDRMLSLGLARSSRAPPGPPKVQFKQGFDSKRDGDGNATHTHARTKRSLSGPAH